MAQTKPKAGQFYGVSGNGTAGQVLISDGNGGMSWGANTELFTISWNTPTGQSLTYTQPSPQSSEGTAGSAFPTTTFTVTKSDTILSGTATIAGLPTGITATQVITGSGIGNTLTVTLSGVFPGVNSLNTDLTLSGLTLSKTVSWATPTGQSLTYTQPSPQSSTGNPGTTFPTTTFTATKSGEEISGTATIAGLPTGITATQSLSGTGTDNILTVTLTGTFPGADSLNTDLTLSGLTVVLPLTVEYLVIAGGGGGGKDRGGGGGAGGYLTNYGGTALTLSASTNYTVTIGAGGNPTPYGNTPTLGSNSVFSTITSSGGGGGGSSTTQGANGGSGGGAPNAGTRLPGSGISGQGFAGGNAANGNTSCGGGGGAGGVGANAASSNAGAGGVGLSSSITGTAVFRGGGGGGGASSGTVAAGGNGGGGAGCSNNSSCTATSGTANTGGGGGGNGGGGGGSGGYGGSGIVILRYPSGFTISGLSGTTTTVGSDKVTTFTTGTGNIQFN